MPHAIGTAAIYDGHVLGSQPSRLGGDVDGGHAAADYHYPAADRQGRQILRLTEIGDVSDRVGDAGCVLVRQSEGVDACKTQSEEYGVKVLTQLGDGEIAAELLAGLDIDAADRQDEVDLRLREIIDGLVGGDAVFVETADLRAAHRR